MSKKLFIISLVFAICLFSASICSATTEMMNDVSNAMQDTGDAIGAGVSGIGNGIENVARDIGNGIESGMDNMENTFTGGMDNRNGGTSDSASIGTNNGGYTATRTAATANDTGMSSTTWTWLIMGIAALAIVALVWYYGTQTHHSNADDNE